MASGEDETVRIWDAKERKEIATLKGHLSFVDAVAFSSNGRLFAIGSAFNGRVYLWDVKGRKMVTVFERRG